jgi:hypothetical protein
VTNGFAFFVPHLPLSWAAIVVVEPAVGKAARFGRVIGAASFTRPSNTVNRPYGVGVWTGPQRGPFQAVDLWIARRLVHREYRKNVGSRPDVQRRKHEFRDAHHRTNDRVHERKIRGDDRGIEQQVNESEVAL